MAMTAEHYQQAGLALLPLGRAWSRALDGQLGRLMLGLGDELARIDAVGDRLLNEMFANNAFMLLPDWEEFAGLPDCPADDDLTIDNRRLALAAKLKMTGSLCTKFLNNSLPSAVIASRSATITRIIVCAPAPTRFTLSQIGGRRMSMLARHSCTT